MFFSPSLLLALLTLAPSEPAAPTASVAVPLAAAPEFVLPKLDNELVLEEPVQELKTKPLERSATFTFRVKNTGRTEVTIPQVRTSCGCSIPRLPAEPWRLAPGASGEFQVIVDLRGKRGELHKTGIIDTTRGTYAVFEFHVIMPQLDPRDEMRQRNLLIAEADRQAVFKNDCAQCHATPAKGKQGRALYLAACAICHADEHRASMVPDLRTLQPAPSAETWRALITHGKDATLMPAFGAAAGGPLTAEQIESLVAYLTTEFTREKPAAK